MSSSPSPSVRQGYTTYSRFLRDKKAFDDYGDKILFSIAKQKRLQSFETQEANEIRCWSCGCSTGEEAYGLNLLWNHRLKRHFGPTVSLDVLGTDVDQGNVDAAIAAKFPPSSVGELPQEWLTKNFSCQKKGREKEYTLEGESKEGVRFECQNALEAMPEGPFDIIMSRYTMCLYFEPEEVITVLGAMVKMLNPGGAIIVGANEKLPQDYKSMGLVAHPSCQGAYTKPWTGPYPETPTHCHAKDAVRFNSLRSLVESITRSKESLPDWILVASGEESHLDHHLQQCLPSFLTADHKTSHMLKASRRILDKAEKAGRFQYGFVQRMQQSADRLARRCTDDPNRLPPGERSGGTPLKAGYARHGMRTVPDRCFKGPSCEPGAVSRFMERLEVDKARREAKDASLVAMRSAETQRATTEFQLDLGPGSGMTKWRVNGTGESMPDEYSSFVKHANGGSRRHGFANTPSMARRGGASSARLDGDAEQHELMSPCNSARHSSRPRLASSGGLNRPWYAPLERMEGDVSPDLEDDRLYYSSNSVIRREENLDGRHDGFGVSRDMGWLRCLIRNREHNHRNKTRDRRMNRQNQPQREEASMPPDAPNADRGSPCNRSPSDSGAKAWSESQNIKLMNAATIKEPLEIRGESGLDEKKSPLDMWLRAQSARYELVSPCPPKRRNGGHSEARWGRAKSGRCVSKNLNPTASQFNPACMKQAFPTRAIARLDRFSVNFVR